MSALSRGGASRLFSYGRSPAYRRISYSYISPLTATFRSQHPLISSASGRSFHCQPHTLQKVKPEENPRTPPSSDTTPGADSESAKASSDDASSRPGSAEQENDKQREQKEDEQADGGKKKKNKEDAAPPPPHGNKSPWQVFTDTLKTEFQASKEWNESTKALASSAQEFTQNETLKRARSTFGAASGAATSTTAKALKTTGKAIGQSAAWTWDTLPVKGIRAGVSATGSGLEKVTRPIRETEAYKSMSDVIDDGSSSRYGGWTDKEQRKRNRENRELKEAIKSGRPMRKPENMEEDVESVKLEW